MSKVWLDQLVLGVLLHCSNWLCVLFLSITDGKQRRGPAEVTVWMLNRSWHLSNDALMMGNELSAHACVKKPKKAPHVSDYPAQARSIGGDATQHPYANYLLSCSSEEVWLHVRGSWFCCLATISSTWEWNFWLPLLLKNRSTSCSLFISPSLLNIWAVAAAWARWALRGFHGREKKNIQWPLLVKVSSQHNSSGI